MSSKVTAELQQLESKTRYLRDTLNSSVTMNSTMFADKPSLKEKYVAAKMNHIKHTFNLWKDSLLRELITADTLTRVPTGNSPKKDSVRASKHQTSKSRSIHKHSSNLCALSPSKYSPTKAESGKYSPKRSTTRSSSRSHHRHTSHHHRSREIVPSEQESIGSKYDYTASERSVSNYDYDNGSVFDYTASDHENSQEDDAGSKYDFTVSDQESNGELSDGDRFDYTASDHPSQVEDDDLPSDGSKFDYTVSGDEGSQASYASATQQPTKRNHRQSNGSKYDYTASEEPRREHHHHRSPTKRRQLPNEDTASSAFDEEPKQRTSPSKMTWPYPKPVRTIAKKPVQESPKKDPSSAPLENENEARDADANHDKQSLSEEIHENDIKITNDLDISHIPKPQEPTNETIINRSINELHPAQEEEEYAEEEDNEEDSDFLHDYLWNNDLPKYIPYEFDSETDKAHIGRFKDSLFPDTRERKVKFEK
ncbi:hypothetical protein TVAG_404100 [Trichomonas vaginalis G3]|uniref:Uncharacterized protein n=1 Tax=Trichomonas vaginalis (strain ATCC PRA-98 / G3) TaxID=412133 RepID=A2EGF9_TRIV3|nr:hypothetical protein TVAGG3_0675680 [Trichomonas vaginalis G3]EAY08242.1 hypothetical protein TVAG_404100 [Trichomonas vaginalis G3]KAI5507520.1 hypothetical protein TVAGG3_0675680 [Trichomonas vaginalis G3]|eukprot:XP_001320465.1 hypothetical protein [Trichomonas vaginalis G3]